MQTEMHRSNVYAQPEQSRSKHRRILRESSSCAAHARPPYGHSMYGPCLLTRCCYVL